MNYRDLVKQNYKYRFLHKMDGTNIRPYYNPVTQRVEFATRGTILGTADAEDESYTDFGKLAREIAEEKYPRLLEAGVVTRHTFVFELIHPKTRVITNYGNQRDLVLIAAFVIGEDGDIHDVGYEALRHLAERFHLNCVEAFVPKSESFFDACEELLKKWSETDLEGSVISFEAPIHVNGAAQAIPQTQFGVGAAHIGFSEWPKTEVVYRLKLKNLRYLDMLKVASLCSFKATKELVQHHNIKNWDELRTVIYGNPAMCEELELEIKQYYEEYLVWVQQIEALQNAIIAEYRSMPKIENDKEFALSIRDNPDMHFFFSARKYEKKHGNLEDFWSSNPKLVAHIEERFPTPT